MLCKLVCHRLYHAFDMISDLVNGPEEEQVPEPAHVIKATPDLIKGSMAVCSSDSCYSV